MALERGPEATAIARELGSLASALAKNGTEALISDRMNEIGTLDLDMPSHTLKTWIFPT